MNVSGENINDMVEVDRFFMREKLSGLFMSLFLTVPMLPKNAAMEIEPILASSLVFPSHSMDSPSTELCFDLQTNAFGNFKKTAKFIGQLNEWARALIFFERLCQEDDDGQADVAEYFKHLRETYKLLPSNAMSVKIYYSQRATKDAEHGSRKYFSQLFVENSSFVDEAEALSSSPVVVIPVVDCGYFGKGTFRSCAFVLEVVSVKNS